MTKILFSNSTKVAGGRVDIFWEKYWEPGFAKPLWRYGETWQWPDGRIQSKIDSDHLLNRPNIKRFIKTYYAENP